MGEFFSRYGGLIAPALTSVAAVLAAMSIRPIWDSLSQQYLRQYERQLSSLGVSQASIPALMRLWGIALMLIAIVFGLVLRWIPIAMVLIYLVLVAPRLVVQWRLGRQRRRLRDGVVGAVRAVSDAVRAGLGLPAAIEAAIGDVPDPMKSVLSSVSQQYRGGRPLATVIREVKSDLNLDSFSLFANVILCASERGGNLRESLDRINLSLAEMQRLERKIDADTASGRFVVLILVLFPALFLMLFGFIDPEGTSLLFSTLAGQLVLTAVAVCSFVALRWSNRIMKIAT